MCGRKRLWVEAEYLSRAGVEGSERDESGGWGCFGVEDSDKENRSD